MQVRKGGAWRSTTSAQAYVNGAWRQIVNGKCFFNGAWRDVCNYAAPPPTPTPTPTPTFSAPVNPKSLSVSAASSNLTTQSVGVTPSGGRAPYFYSWTIISSDSNATYSLSSPSSASTTVTASGLDPSISGECTVQCVCNDSTGLSATTPGIGCTFFNSSTS